jgi:HPt (histidine-containing phosphotransfer) domain-containing protein
MDVQMPDGDGFETTAAIRAREAGGTRVPIVALTAQREDRTRCLAPGMDDYLSKPVVPAELAGSLERVVAPRTAAMRRQAPIPAPRRVRRRRGVDAVRGRTDRMRHVWRITRSTLPGYMDGLSAAVESGDWATAARHAHSLAGSASNFGAHALVATARRIEDHAGEGQCPP